MGKLQLSTKNLHELDNGIVGEVIDAEIKNCLLDCLDRPHDNKARKVQITIDISPVMMKGDCERVEVQVHASSSVPKKRANMQALAINVKGQAYFQEFAQDNPDQTTIPSLDELADGEGKKGRSRK